MSHPSRPFLSLLSFNFLPFTFTVLPLLSCCTSVSFPLHWQEREMTADPQSLLRLWIGNFLSVSLAVANRQSRSIHSDTLIALNIQPFHLLLRILFIHRFPILTQGAHTHRVCLAELGSASSAWALALEARCGWMETSVALWWEGGERRKRKTQGEETQQRSSDEINVQSETCAIMEEKQWQRATEKKQIKMRERERNKGNDCIECRAGRWQSGLLQQECSSGCRKRGEKEGEEEM